MKSSFDCIALCRYLELCKYAKSHACIVVVVVVVVVADAAAIRYHRYQHQFGTSVAIKQKKYYKVIYIEIKKCGVSKNIV